MAGLIPIDEIRRLQKKMNRLMEDLGLSDLESRYTGEMQRIQDRLGGIMQEYDVTGMSNGTLMPLADVRETDDAVVVSMDMPGVSKDDVDLTVVNDELRVTAERSAETEARDQDFHRRERTYTRFERMVKLPVGVKADEAGAKLEDGVLTVTLPKEVVTSRKKISIE